MDVLSKLKLNFIPTSPEDAVNKAYVDQKTENAYIYHYCGTLSTYNDLPVDNLEVGMVYNIEHEDLEHGIKQGDNLAWDGTKWDNLSGYVDLSGFYTKDEVDNIVSEVQRKFNTVYFGKITKSGNKVNIISEEFSEENINSHSILVLDSNFVDGSSTVLNKKVLINSNRTDFEIHGKYSSIVRIRDISSGNVLLSFDGENFTILNREILIDSYHDNSIMNAPTVNALTQVYNYFESAIGDIPEVLDSINRVVI